MLNTTVAAKSAWKSTVITFVMALGVAILGGVADLFADTAILSTIFSDPKLQMFLIPAFAWFSQFLKDYIKHA